MEFLNRKTKNRKCVIPIWPFPMFLILLLASSLQAGPYAPAAGEEETTAVSMNSDDFVAWAAGWTNLAYGDEVSSTFKTPENALGAAGGNAYDIVSLGRGGNITLTFDAPIRNGSGWDFAIFENAFNDAFLELAYVEVSSNGSDFVRFDNYSLTPSSVSEYGGLDPSNVDGLAGKYRIGYGTPFDLSVLYLTDEVISKTVDLSAISHIRIVDIVGDGTYLDSAGNSIYDPYPTTGSAGFDLEAVGVRYESLSASSYAPSDPELSSPANNESSITLTPTLTINAFTDLDTHDFHLATWWQLSEDHSFNATNLVFSGASRTKLESLTVPDLVLDANKTYYWKTRVYDSSGSRSNWSDSFQFTTTDTEETPTYVSKDWDGDGVADPEIVTVSSTNSNGEECFIGLAADANVTNVSIVKSYAVSEAPDNDTGNSYPLGLFGFRLTVTDSNQPVVLTIYLSSAAPDGTEWYTYNAVNGWQSDETVVFDGNRSKVTLTLEEGTYQTGDGDNVENQTIIYLGGPVETGETANTDSDDAGIGEKGGCLIRVTRQGFPKKPFVLLLLIASLAIALSGRSKDYKGGNNTKKKRKFPVP